MCSYAIVVGKQFSSPAKKRGTAVPAVAALASCQCNIQSMLLWITMPSIQKRRGAYLPHWAREGAIYSVRFRLADSVPQEKLREWEFERKDIIANAKKLSRELSSSERLELERLHTGIVEQYLRTGYGSCWLRNDSIAEAVANAIGFFDKKRYLLFAWCIMPNHVHVILQPHTGVTLSSIMFSWKSFTAKKANSLLGRTGKFWQGEYFDRLIRTEIEFRHSIEYVWTNPDMARLKDWQWRWKMNDSLLRDAIENTFHTARAGSTCRHAPEV